MKIIIIRGGAGRATQNKMMENEVELIQKMKFNNLIATQRIMR